MSKKANKKILFSLLAAILLFVILLNVEKGMLVNYEKVEVLIAKQKVSEGTKITKENAAQYFEVYEVPKKLKTAQTICNLDEIAESRATETIEVNTILDTGRLENLQKIRDDLKNPVEISIKSNDIGEMVGGSIRPGDRISIFSFSKETGKSTEILSEAYVEKVFEGSGVVIESQELRSPAMVINLWVEKEEVSLVHEKIQNSESILFCKIS